MEFLTGSGLDRRRLGYAGRSAAAKRNDADDGRSELAFGWKLLPQLLTRRVASRHQNCNLAL